MSAEVAVTNRAGVPAAGAAASVVPGAGAPVAVPEAPADLRLPARASTRAAAGHLVKLLARPTLADRSGWALPVTALAVASALTLSVAGGVHWFFGLDGQVAGLYKMFSVVALVLLVVPLMTLAGAAARLSASRRDVRLSSLRLLGAGRATLRLLTLAENAATALAGALLGVVGYAALMPLFGLLHFEGRAIGAGGLWLGVLPVLGAVVGIVLVVVLSSAVGLRRVEISPLGVRTRSKAPVAGVWRIVAGVGAIAVAMGLGKLVNGRMSVVVVSLVMLVVLTLPLVAVNQMGPWVVARIARRDLRRAKTPVALVAARTVLENPKQSWRQVGALAMASFVSVMTGVGMAMASGNIRTPMDRMMFGDIRTGVMLTLAICFITVAFSVGINQSAAVLDRRSLYVGLDMLGMPASLSDAARRRAVLRPMVAVVLMGAVAGFLLVMPLGAANKAFQPASLITVAAVLVAGIALVWAGMRATGLVLRQVLAQGLARVE